jgi:methionine-gamma-lyase
MTKSTKKTGKATRAIHAGQAPDPAFGALSPPIFQTSTFVFPSVEAGAARFAGKEPGYIYTRLGNPTTRMLEDNVAAMEGGYAGLATSSGMAAVSTTYFALLSGGDHMVATEALYGASRTIMEREFSRFGVESTFVDTSDLGAVERAITRKTRLLYLETPANPTLKITDIRACADLAHARGILLAVDNTFCSPYLQRPIEMGADVVLHSVTKFLNGHSDVVGGILIAANQEIHERLRSRLLSLGATMDPHQAWLVLRGIKTLPARMEWAQKSSLRIARFLESHPKVEWVRYPGLESHPQYDLVRRQQDGPGAILAFGLRGGLEAGRRLMESIRLASLAVSLGGVETLIEHPASMTHACMTRESREESGITDGLVRLSVGCEDAEDLIEDLREGLEAV